MVEVARRCGDAKGVSLEGARMEIYIHIDLEGLNTLAMLLPLVGTALGMFNRKYS